MGFALSLKFFSGTMMQNQGSLDESKARRAVTRRRALAFAGSLGAATTFGA
jgi:hypothetical protein